MSRLKTALLVATAAVALGAGGVAWAQMGETYDPNQLPETKGKVAQYTLTPRGDIDGFLLADGTEVHVPPHMSTDLAFAVRPGDEVTIHGLKARVLPMVAAMSVTNDATHTTITAEPPFPMPLEAHGTVKEQLHGPRGDLNGVLLDNGTEVRLPPPEAQRLAADLAIGKPLFVRGHGSQGPLGTVIAARQIGADADHLTTIAGPMMGGMMEHWMHGRDDHDMHWGHGPMMHPGDMPPPPPPAPQP